MVMRIPAMPPADTVLLGINLIAFLGWQEPFWKRRQEEEVVVVVEVASGGVNGTITMSLHEAASSS